MEQYEKIQQLLKKEPGTKERVPIFPPTVIQAVFDAKTGASLEAILAQFNSITVQYQGSPRDTRMLIPADMRRPGLIITYVNAEGETVSERASLHGQADDEHWALDVNWSRIDELSLSGDIAVSARGTWIINGADTGIKAVGPKGENGITPWLKEIDNKLHYSYDNVKWTSCSGPLSAQFRNHNNHVQVSYDKGKTWANVSDPVATYVRFAATSSTSQDGSIGKIQYSYDKATWHDLSPEFRNYLRIQGYVATHGDLPTGVPVGTIYGVGPFYEIGDINNTNPMYQLQVWDGTQWVHNGRFNSIAAGIVQETGDSETEVMSQKAVSQEVHKLEFYGGVDVSHWGIPVSEIDKRKGYIKLDGTFEYRDTYITKLYNLEDITKGVVSIQEFGIGFYSLGICDVNYNLIKPFRECNSISDMQNILFSIILDKNENYLFITSRVDAGSDAEFYDKDSGFKKIQEISNITNELNKYIDIEVLPTDIKVGYFTTDNQFQSNENYETRFYKIEDSDYIINGYDYGSGIITYGYMEVISENPNDLLSYNFMTAENPKRINYFIKKEDIPNGAKYIVIVKRKTLNKELILHQEKLVTDRLFNKEYTNSVEIVSYCGYMPNESDIWQENYNYKTHYYEINNLFDYKIIGHDLGAGIPTYGFATNISKERSSIISYIPMDSGGGITEVNINIAKDEIPIDANYIFVVSRISNPKSLYELNKYFIPESNRKRIENLEQSRTNSYFRARVVDYTDNVVGTEYTDNNVNRTFRLLQVIRRYNSTHDIMICIGLNGPNGMFGLRGWRLIENSSNSLAEFPLDTSFTEMGETIGPWQIQSVNNPIGDSGQYFVGGFHGLINPYTNNHYPSAKNLEYKFYADNREISVGDEVLCNSIKATSSVNICSSNTFNKESNTAREVLNYKDTYQMMGDKIYVFAKFTALEDITINLHYGLQTDKFNPIIGYLTDNGLTETDTNIDYEGKSIPFLPSLVYAKRNDGNTLFCKMYNKGAMTGERDNDIKAFQVSYGVGNTKTYHWVYGNGKIGNLKSGDTNYYCGWFSISDKDFADIE